MNTRPEISCTEDITLITLQDIPCDLSFIGKVFDSLAKEGINVDMISISPPQGGLISLSFTIDDSALGQLLELNTRMRAETSNMKVIVSSGNCKISILDPSMEYTPGFAAKVFQAASAAGADLRVLTTSDVQISLLVTEAAFDSTFQAITDAMAFA
jgi:aspartokinase